MLHTGSSDAAQTLDCSRNRSWKPPVRQGVVVLDQRAWSSPESPEASFDVEDARVERSAVPVAVHYGSAVTGRPISTTDVEVVLQEADGPNRT